MEQEEQRELALRSYDEARGWLAFLIDHSDKEVSVAAYKAQIRDAQKAVKAAHKEWMAAWA